MYSDWESEIVTKNIESRLRLGIQLGDFSKSNQEEIEKSITDDISYSTDFQIEKTGKEIKEKLNVELLTIMSDKKSFLEKMEILVKEIGQLPMGRSESWRTRGFEKYLGEIPKQYSYDQIYPNKQKDESKSDGMYLEEYTPSGFPGGITPIDPKIVCDKMREFNQISSDYITRCVEEIKLKTVIENLSDTKKIKLQPQLAAQLGF